MSKIYTIIVVFLGLVASWYVIKDIHSQNTILSLQTENNALRGNNSFLEKRIEKERQDALEVSERNQEMEQAAKLDKSFNWNLRLPSGTILNRLHEDSH